MTFPLEPPALRSRPRLTWTDEAGSHALTLEAPVVVGSAPRAELVVADRAVSRLHAELAPREDGLWVRDLGSRNGTYVAGVKVERARAPSGASIRVGTTDIRVAYEAPKAPERVWPEATFHGLVARSAAMREVFAQVAELAKSARHVILLGESGTGKEALARALHDLSDQADRPFVVVDCAALPEPALAAELLEEALRSAEGGTLLLDEPAELSLALQRELVPPFAAEAFRTIVTTSRDLRDLVNQGAFREDLYFRLAGATVTVPALRHRALDIDILLARLLGDEAGLASPDLVADLSRLPWTGNVRELSRFVEALVSGRAETAPGLPGVEARWLEAEVGTQELELGAPDVRPVEDPGEGAERARAIPPPASGGQALLPPGLEPWFEIGFKEFREKWIELGEREYLRRLLARTHRSSSMASREAGLERTYLYRLIKKHGV